MECLSTFNVIMLAFGHFSLGWCIGGLLYKAFGPKKKV